MRCGFSGLAAKFDERKCSSSTQLTPNLNALNRLVGTIKKVYIVDPNVVCKVAIFFFFFFLVGAKTRYLTPCALTSEEPFILIKQSITIFGNNITSLIGVMNTFRSAD